jgi:putative Holliday junction resolvase
MKYLGIDYGKKRVGIALSDETGNFAFPKAIVENKKALEDIFTICNEEKLSGIVLGESVSSNGIKNEIDIEIKSFAKKLGDKTDLPIFFEREDFSSVEASRYQTNSGKKDDSAAAIILQRFLDKKQNK